MSKKLRFAFFIAVFVFVSLQYSTIARGFIANLTNSVIKAYLDSVSYIEYRVTEHFNQKDEIQRLRVQNEELKRSALLSVAFAGKLNNILDINNKKEFNPEIALVHALSYVNLSDYDKVWIDIEDFNASKIYGLTYQGNSAGIIVEKDGKALGLLQGDAKCIFSVAVGEEMIPGVAMGQGEFIHVKYIPLWMSPKKGDKVVTSGLDNIFFEGIPVGEVVDIVQEESYQTAIVKPNTIPNTPAFFYAIL